jgi:hypothetical protein
MLISASSKYMIQKVDSTSSESKKKKTEKYKPQDLKDTSDLKMVTPITDIQTTPVQDTSMPNVINSIDESPELVESTLPMTTPISSLSIVPEGDITSILKQKDANAFINTDILSRNSHTPFEHLTQTKPDELDIRQQAFGAYQGHVKNQAEMFKEGIDRYVNNRHNNFNNYRYNSY